MEVDNVAGQVHKHLWSLYSEDRKIDRLEVIPKNTQFTCNVEMEPLITPATQSNVFATLTINFNFKAKYSDFASCDCYANTLFVVTACE